MLSRRGSVLLLAALLLSACGSQSSEPVFETRFALGPESSIRRTVKVGEVGAGSHILELTLSRDIHVAIALRTPLRESSGPTFSFNRDAQHSGGSCQKLDTGEQTCWLSREHGALPAGTWAISARSQSDVAADVTIRVIDAARGWGEAGVVLAIALILVTGFWFWWRLPNRGRLEGEPIDQDDPADSRERLGLLRAARRWSDVSTDAGLYLRRRSRR